MTIQAGINASGAVKFSITIEPGQEEMWFALRDLPNAKKGFTADDLAHVAGVKPSLAEIYLNLLVNAGAALRVGKTDGRKDLFAIVRHQVEPVVLTVKGTPSQDYEMRRAMWTVIRTADTFTIKSLWDTVRQHIEVTRKQVTFFVEHLHEAGYLAPLFGDCRGEEEFMLKPSMNTGRFPPRLCETSLVYDINRRAFYGTALAREVRL